MVITLVPKNMATEGSRFQYFSSAPECGICNLRNVCHNLKAGAYYVVTKSREKEHDCFIHQGGKVYTVEVEEERRHLMIQKKVAREGAKVTYKYPECDDYDCKFANICILSFTKNQSKVKVNSIGENSCPRGYGLVEADVE
jgi:uncharacterized protein (UPF0179 family)